LEETIATKITSVSVILKYRQQDFFSKSYSQILGQLRGAIDRICARKKNVSSDITMDFFYSRKA
jgi:hypothetical protein